MYFLEEVEPPVGVRFVRAREPVERRPERRRSLRVQAVLPRARIWRKTHVRKVVVPEAIFLQPDPGAALRYTPPDRLGEVRSGSRSRSLRGRLIREHCLQASCDSHGVRRHVLLAWENPRLKLEAVIAPPHERGRHLRHVRDHRSLELAA